MVLQVLTVLVKYGYYDDSADIDDVLPSLHKLMNGNKDYPTQQIKEIMSSGLFSFPIRASSIRRRKSAQDVLTACYGKHNALGKSTSTLATLIYTIIDSLKYMQIHYTMYVVKL